MKPTHFPLFFAVSTLLSFAAFGQEIDPATKDGKALYEAWCAHCHGLDGRGPAEDLQLDTPPPDLAECSFNSREPRKDWKAVILHGGPARGLSMTMPAWTEAVSEDQADAIIAHIKSFCTDASWPPGELNFRRTHGTVKAFPENEALLIPTFTKTTDAVALTKFVYEERVGSIGQWEVSVPLHSNLTPAVTGGLGDIELAGKYTLHHDIEDLSILSAGVEIALPTGRSTRGFGSGAWKLSPFVAASKGYEKVTVQGSLKLEKPLAAGGETEFRYDIALTFPLTSEKQGFFPMVELNGAKILGEPTNRLLITPQVYIAPGKRGHLAISIGVQAPVAGEKPFDYRIVTFLLWEYADGGLWW